MAAWLLHGLCCGEEAGAGNLVFFRVKWLQATMKGTSCVPRVRLRSFWFLLCALQQEVVPVCVVLFVSWIADRSGMAAWLLHGLCRGEEAGARNRAFFRVKWLQETMKGTSCAAGAAAVVLVPPLCFATRGCSCVRSFMRFLNLWLQIAVEWLHDCCMGYVVGRKPEHETACFSV